MALTVGARPTKSRPAVKPRLSKATRKQTLIAWGFSAPFVILFLVFMAGPILASFAMSFTDLTTRDLRSPFNVNIIGLDNYIRLFEDPRFVHSLLNTAIFVVVGVPVTIVLSLLVALALNTALKGRNFFRGVYFLPVVTSWIAVSLVWRWLLNPHSGAVNAVLGWFGIDGPGWYTDPHWAMP